jgi:hypothetical protein
VRDEHGTKPTRSFLSALKSRIDELPAPSSRQGASGARRTAREIARFVEEIARFVENQHYAVGIPE